MSVAITIVPASGSVHAKNSACRVHVTGANDTDPTTYDVTKTPRETAIWFRLVASQDGHDDLVSHEFEVSTSGEHTWDNIIFPATGTWSLKLVDQRNDSVAATLSVSVV
jgi:hypothetical protein